MKHILLVVFSFIVMVENETIKINGRSKTKGKSFFQNKLNFGQNSYYEQLKKLSQPEVDRDLGTLREELVNARPGVKLSWDGYPTLDDINKYIDSLGEKYSDFVSVQLAGYSYKGRPIKIVQIISGYPYAKTNDAAPIVQTVTSAGGCVWVPSSRGDIPLNAISAGADGETVYVGRSKHRSGALLPGKVVPSHGFCYVPFNGREYSFSDYEVLAGCNVKWVPSRGDVPVGAITAGKSEDGEILYVGRTLHEGHIAVGKVQSSHRALYIPYGGSEFKYNSYEILVAQ